MSIIIKEFSCSLAGTLLLLSSPLVACHAAPQRQDAVVTQPAIASVLERPQLFAGAMVTLEGVFTGWKGSCRGPAPATRSDWMIEDDGACLYVTGALSDGFSPVPPARGIGKRLAVSGKIELTPDGRPFLRRAQ